MREGKLNGYSTNQYLRKSVKIWASNDELKSSDLLTHGTWFDSFGVNVPIGYPYPGAMISYPLRGNQRMGQYTE